MAEIAGLKLIVPSSVAGSGVSVSASGKVTFTAATTINVNGVFSSTYDNYLVVIGGTATDDASLNCRLRASGSDASGADYVYQTLNANNTSVLGSRQSAQSVTRFGSLMSTDMSGIHAYFYGPALAQPTAIRGVTAEGLSGGVRIFDVASTHSLSTAYDGFTLSNKTLTGSLTIYGLSQ